MRCLPFSTTVPTPVGVSTPPRPKPPARMRSISVPCGTRSTSSSPASIFFCVSGLRPMWLAIVFFTAPALISLPMPTPGIALSFAITVRSALALAHQLVHQALGRADAHESADHHARAVGDQRHGVLQRNGFHWAVQPPSTGSAMPRICAAACEHRNSAARADLLRRRELERGLLFAEQLHPCRIGSELFPGGEIVDLLLHERRQHPAGADRVAGDAGGRGFERHDLGQSEDAVLRRDVGRLLRRRDEAVRRGDVDDRGPSCAPSCAAARRGWRGRRPRD